MSKTKTPSRQQRRKGLYRILRQNQAEQGFKPKEKAALPNHKSPFQTPEEEQAARQALIEAQLKNLRPLLPGLLTDLSKIEDPRRPGSVKHQLTTVLMYGFLLFVYHIGSRREANRIMSEPIFKENLKELFPELETLPHADTLERLLETIDVENLEEALIHIIQKLMRGKKLRDFLVTKDYLIAIDGTRKMSRSYQWSEECLRKRIRGTEDQYEYFVYTLEANFVFSNGLTLPLMTEFLDNTSDVDPESKQDCESKGFKRLAARLKDYFPRLAIKVLLDGLYANGPVIELCKKNNWEFMIVLQDDSLKSVWEEANGLHKLERENCKEQKWGNREQTFWWVNNIPYDYLCQGKWKHLTVNVVVCEESWSELNPMGQIITKHSRHAWLSSRELTKNNVHNYCNLEARYRWSLENNFLVEKHQGYGYEHTYSYDWQAMKGYHYLMRLAHLLNNVVMRGVEMVDWVKQKGIRGLIHFLRQALSGALLNHVALRELLSKKFQLRLTI